MAQSILLKRSSVAGNVPDSSDLSLGEVAINTADGAVYIKKGNNDIVAVHDNDILHIDTLNSRIGIGTTSPSYRLHVDSGTSDWPALFKSTDEKAGIVIQDSNTVNYVVSKSYTLSLGNQADLHADNLNVKSTGKVGLGTTSPSKRLHVKDSAAHQLQLQGSNSYWNIGTGWSGYYQDYFLVANSSGEKLVIDSNGLVGIGTNSPSQKLDVVGHVNINTPSGASQSGYALRLNKTNSSSQVQLGAELLASPWASNTNGGNLIIKTANSSGIATNAMAIDGAQNVGIGTTSPAHKLHVNGGALFNTNTGSNPIYITRSGATDQALKLYTDDANVIFESIQDESLDNYGGFIFAMDSGTTHPFFDVRKGTSSSGTKLRVDGSGNVGIGTTSPDSKLTVNVSTNSDGIELQSNETSIAKLSRTTVGSTVVPSLDGVTGRPIHIGGIVNEDVILANAGGNVGIGTDNPTNKLHLSGDTVNLALDGTGNAGTPITSISLSRGSVDWGIHSGIGGANLFGIKDNQNSAYRLAIDSSGSVGIGTTSPTGAKLHVTGGVKATDLIAHDSTGINLQTDEGTKRLVVADNGVITFNQAYSFPTSDGSANQVLKTDGSGNLTFATVSGAGSVSTVSDADGDTKIQVEESTDEDIIRFDTAGTERMTISSSGVQASTYFSTTNTSNGLLIGSNKARFKVNGDNTVIDAIPGSGGINFRTGGAIQRMHIGSDGNVGIGTTSPNAHTNQTTLTINGTTHGRIDFETGDTLRGSIYGDSGTLNLDAGGNYIRFYTGNSERMRLDASGRLSLSGQTTNYLTHDTNYLRHTTASGYIQIGPGNTSHAHILTDRSNFYFNKQIQVDTGVITSHDEDLILRRAQTSTTGQLTLSRGKFTGGSQSATDLLNSSLVLGGFHANSAFEEAYGHFYIPGLSPNNLAGSHRRHNVTVTKNGTALSQDFSNMFSANGANTSFSHAAGSTDTIVVTITGIAMSYGQHVGVQFGHPTFRAKDIEIEISTDNGSTWTSIYDVTNFPYATVAHYHGGSGTATNGIRYTFTNFNNTGMRINQLFCYDYSENEIYFAEKNQDQLIRGHWTWADNYEARFGNSGDLKIKHDGNHSYIQDVGTGSLYLDTSSLLVRNPSNNANMIVANAGSTVTLYHNGSAKIATKADGVDVTGELQSDSLDVDGNADISGNLVLGGNLTVNGTSTTLNTATLDVEDKNITLNKGSGDTSGSADGAGITIQDAVNSNTDASITWNAAGDKFVTSHPVRAFGGFELPDNNKLVAGDSNDLQFFHDGSNSYIQHGNTGNFNITTAAGSEFAFVAQNNGSVYLYHDGTAKFQTTSSGIDVTGSVTSDSLTITGTNANLVLGTSGNNIDFGRDADNYISAQTGTSSNIVIDPQNRFVVRTNDTERMRIDSSGRVGIGTSSPSSKLVVADNGGAGLEVIPQTTNDRVTLLSYDRNTSTYQTVDLDGSEIHFNIAGNEKAKVDSSGRVLIGTSTMFSDANADDLQVGNTSGAHGISIMSQNSHNGNLFFGDNDNNDAGRISYNHTNNRMEFYTNRSQRLVIDSSGNVGIGLNNQTRELEVYRTGASVIAIKTNTTGLSQLALGDTDDDNYGQIILDNSTNKLQIQNGGGNVISDRGITLDSSENVGIGTSSPVAPLHVKGDAIDDQALAVFENTHSGGVFYPAAKFLHTNSDHSYGITAEFRTQGTSTDRPSILFSNGDTNNNWQVGQGAYGANDNFAIGYRTAHPNTTPGWSTARFVIDTSGNVGIGGITSPAQKLHISGNAEVNGNIYFDGSTTGSHNISYGTGTTQPTVAFWGEDHASYPGQVHIVGRSDNTAAHSGEISFWDYHGSGWNRNMLIQKTGNVSIGPSTAFTVGGTAKLSLSSNNGVYLTAGNSNSDLIYSRRQNAGHFQTQAYNGGNNGVIEHNPYGGKVGIGTAGTVSSTFQVEALGIDTTSTSTSATTQVAIHTFAAATYRSARFTVQVTNNTDSTYHTTELLLVHDGTTANITEFGEIHTGSAVEATFDCDVSSGNVRLLATPASTDSMTFRVVCHSITV